MSDSSSPKQQQQRGRRGYYRSGEWTEEEDLALREAHRLYGGQYKEIKRLFRGRKSILVVYSSPSAISSLGMHL